MGAQQNPRNLADQTAPAPLFVAEHVDCTVPNDSGGKRVIFDDLAFHVNAGEIVDLTGASGAGKTTLLTAFARLNVNTTGTFTLAGRDSGDFTPQEWRRAVSYLPQTSMLMGETVADAVRLPWTFKVRSRATKGAGKTPRELLPDATIRALLDEMGCEDIDLARPPANLSGGQAARVSLCRTLLTHPRVLLADEVDAGLDAENAAKVGVVFTKAAAGGMAIIRIRHRQSDHRAKRIMVLENGKLHEEQAGEPVEAIAR
ncbi:ATP-binding cassette domain-containing protein [Bifidobacterium choloepi]|uniref:ATP-binding cassette domain-containing protein n=1 Tax=Bifidobacterium choloepi TaxID=2614131 RepID=A0A6I5NDZ5_9BIFI|nr:ATP-binding cassette domain-containing protein [Bifidobacterium choloepi]NEG69604.1 ATP-binding cassette domain-containing protein [Bifidobacterium choloepi]